MRTDNTSLLEAYRKATSYLSRDPQEIDGLIVDGCSSTILPILPYMDLRIGKRSNDAYEALNILIEEGSVILTDKNQSSILNRILRNLLIANVIVTDGQSYKFTPYSRTPYSSK